MAVLLCVPSNWMRKGRVRVQNDIRKVSQLVESRKSRLLTPFITLCLLSIFLAKIFCLDCIGYIKKPNEHLEID